MLSRSIGERAFFECSLNSVSFSSNLKNIGVCAFYGCNGLTSVTLPNGVQTIDIFAFCNCKSLTSINIPSSVTYLGERAFLNCYSLTSITIPDNIPSIGMYTFGDCTSLSSVTLGNNVKSIGDWAFNNCSKLTTFTIPQSVESIGNCAFQNCTGLKEIYCNPVKTPEVFAKSFNNLNVGNILLFVQDEAYQAYKNHEVWGLFWVESPTGINENHLTEDLGQQLVYDLNGRRRSAPQKGLNIIGGKKVVMK